MPLPGCIFKEHHIALSKTLRVTLGNSEIYLPFQNDNILPSGGIVPGEVIVFRSLTKDYASGFL